MLTSGTMTTAVSASDYFTHHQMRFNESVRLPLLVNGESQRLSCMVSSIHATFCEVPWTYGFMAEVLASGVTGPTPCDCDELLLTLMTLSSYAALLSRADRLFNEPLSQVSVKMRYCPIGQGALAIAKLVRTLSECRPRLS